SGKLNEDVSVPTLIANSGSWSREQGHFTTVRNLTQGIMTRNRENGKDVKAWFATLLHTAHPSVTDAPLIEPWLLNFATGASLDVRVAMDAYVDVSDQFMQYVRSGEIEGVLAQKVDDRDGEVVRGEEKGMDPTDPDERGQMKGRPTREELKKKSEGARKKEDKAVWAVHVAPQ
ncbi:MAG: hypothetical protein M1820_004803, partial [Bogoriella megaspora]